MQRAPSSVPNSHLILVTLSLRMKLGNVCREADFEYYFWCRILNLGFPYRLRVYSKIDGSGVLSEKG